MTLKNNDRVALPGHMVKALLEHSPAVSEATQYECTSGKPLANARDMYEHARKHIYMRNTQANGKDEEPSVNTREKCNSNARTAPT